MIPPESDMTQEELATLPPKPADTRYLSFDFWRGVACLMLLAYHATFYADHLLDPRNVDSWSVGAWTVKLISLMWIGVPMFFVVSGYCIAGSIDSLRRKPHSLSSYFVRRMRRIYPPLWIMAAIAVTFSLVMRSIDLLNQRCEQLPHLAEFSFWTWLGNITASESWLHLFVGSKDATYIMANTWTLCYEEQFYALAGLMLVFSARRFFLASAVIAALTIVCRHVFRSVGIETHGFFFDGHWLLFSAGILVYHCVNYGTRKSVAISCGVLLTAMAYAVLDRRLQTSHFERHLDEYIIISSGFAIALIAMKRWDKWFASLKLIRPIAICGSMSYSIYLTHYLLVVVIACLMAHVGLHSDDQVALIVVPACIALAIPPAWLFHRYVERPFMNQAA